MSKKDERRHFWRATFDAPVRLIDSRGSTEAHLVDLSLKGALVGVEDTHWLKQGDRCQLHLQLGEDVAINMWTTAAHVEGHRVGLYCDHIDLDSITHLRRLVELNAGNSQLLDRELSELLKGE